MRCRIPCASREYRGALRAAPSGVAYPFALGPVSSCPRRAPAPRPPSRQECFAYLELLEPKSKVRAGLAGRTHYTRDSRLRLEAVERVVERGRMRIRSPVLPVRSGTPQGERTKPWCVPASLLRRSGMRFEWCSRARLHPGGRPAPAPVRRARRAALRAGGWRLRGAPRAL